MTSASGDVIHEAIAEMCGIAAVLYKTGVSDSSQPPIGARLRDMLYAMRHRGVDSTGATIGGQNYTSDYVMRIFFPNRTEDPEQAGEAICAQIKKCGGVVRLLKNDDAFYRIGFDYSGSLRKLSNAVLEVGGAEIHSVGRNSEVIKDVGDAYDLDRKHGISKINGTHGLGHVRLATESQVDISHSHPFWAFPFPDIAVVHNGQLTNYHTLKRQFEQRGFRFQTHNDSEVIAVYIADKLSKGEKLGDVLKESLDDLDGTFTYVVSTDSGLGVAKDRWSAKPFVVFETSDLLGVASEEVALSGIFPSELKRFEPQENEVLTWEVGLRPVITRGSSNSNRKSRVLKTR